MNNGTDHYKEIKEIADRIIKGTSKISRLLERDEKGRIEGGRRNVEASILLGTDEKSNPRTNFSNIKEFEKHQECLLENYAELEGIWLDYEKDIKKNGIL